MRCEALARNDTFFDTLTAPEIRGGAYSCQGLVDLLQQFRIRAENGTIGAEADGIPVTGCNGGDVAPILDIT